MPFGLTAGDMAGGGVIFFVFAIGYWIEKTTTK